MTDKPVCIGEDVFAAFDGHVIRLTSPACPEGITFDLYQLNVLLSLVKKVKEKNNADTQR